MLVKKDRHSMLPRPSFFSELDETQPSLDRLCTRLTHRPRVWDVEVDPDRIEARFHDGVLEPTMPVLANAEPRVLELHAA